MSPQEAATKQCRIAGHVGIAEGQSLVPGRSQRIPIYPTCAGPQCMQWVGDDNEGQCGLVQRQGAIHAFQ